MEFPGPRSQNVIDHRGDDWRLRTLIASGANEDEGPQQDLGPRWNALAEAIIKRRLAQQPEPQTNPMSEWLADFLQRVRR